MKRILQSLDALPFDRIARHPDLVLTALVAAVIAVLIIPVPAGLLDVLLAANLTLCALVLAAVLLSERSLAISSFPTVLLLTTLFRLTLNVSTTRQILSTGQAGEVVRAFGEFVLSGDVIVGLVVFLIITLVQFIVIAKGAERVAEVGARFTLDAMPGKQMAIEASLRAGALSEEEATTKRDELGRESQFYGAMDGAMKFVKGDAVAGLIITAINLIAGIAIGVLRFRMSAGEAVEAYSVLSVGDGLIAQIPALLITLAAGVLTTRVAAKDDRSSLGASLRSELFTSPKVLAVSACFALLLAVVPGLPALPFGILAAALGVAAAAKTRKPRAAAAGGGATQRAEALRAEVAEKVKKAKAQRSVADNMAPAVLPLAIDLGAALSEALGFGGDAEPELTELTLPALRDALYVESGVRFPGVRVRAHAPALAPDAIVIRVKDIPVATETVHPTMWLALESVERLARLGVRAETAPHPLGAGDAAYVSAEAAVRLEMTGVKVWAPCSVVAIHVARVLRRHMKLFVGLQETSELVERLEKVYPALVREVVPKVISLTQLADILQRLVDENVSIRDLKSVFEMLALHGPHQTDSVALTELVRGGLSLQLAHAYAGSTNRLPVVLLDDVIEDTVRAAITETAGGTYLALDPEVRRSMIDAIAKTVRPVARAGVRPVILTHAEIRRYVRKLVEENLPEAAVLSFQELPSQLTIQPLGRAMVRELAA